MANQSEIVRVEIEKNRTLFDPMSDQEIANVLNVKDIDRSRDEISAQELFRAIDQVEFDGLDPAKRAAVRELYTLFDSVDLRDGSRERVILDGAFAFPSATQTNITAEREETISLAQQADITREVGRGWVINARRAMGVYKIGPKFERDAETGEVVMEANGTTPVNTTNWPRSSVDAIGRE